MNVRRENCSYAVIILCITVTAAGCAQVKQYVPKPVSTQYTLPGLPSNLVRIRVSDLRPEREGSAQLVRLIKQQIESALSPQRVNQTTGLYNLKVDVVEHRAYFTLGNWNATTKLHLMLLSPRGKVLGKWMVLGNAHRSNMLGYASAKSVSQDSYNSAIADLMSKLSSVSIRE